MGKYVKMVNEKYFKIRVGKQINIITENLIVLRQKRDNLNNQISNLVTTRDLLKKSKKLISNKNNILNHYCLFCEKTTEFKPISDELYTHKCTNCKRSYLK